MLKLSFMLLRRCYQNPYIIWTNCLSNGKVTIPQLDFDYLCDNDNYKEIKERIIRRKGVGDIDLVKELYNEHLKVNASKSDDIQNKLVKEALKIPNKSHPDIIDFEDEPKIIKYIGKEKNWKFKPRTFEELAHKLNLIKTENISNYTGPRSYYLIDQLAQLEQALIQYSISNLLKKGFNLISVPDILPKQVIDYCGMNTEGERTQVYKLENTQLGKDLCLSGTAEMGIAGYLQNKEFSISELPLKLASVSRCFRAETSKISEEKGLYRVHQFTKVEMFGVTTKDGSTSLLDEFRNYEETTFTEMGLQLRVLDMPESELGSQAYKKYDIEVFMPGKKRWGELSSTSDCTDYQSRRLNIKYDGQFAHTVNGTACAVPRMIIALMETHQNKMGTVDIPDALVPFLGFKTIEKSKVPKFRKFKNS